jgi:hypothetical protein
LKEVREKLAGGYAAALRCGEASCLAEAADTLEADLLVTSRLALEDDGWTLRLWTYDRDRKLLRRTYSRAARLGTRSSRRQARSCWHSESKGWPGSAPSSR